MCPSEVPLEQAQEEIQHHAHEALERWIMGVALTAALAAALAAITALMAEHHATEAMITQMQRSDHWGHYQAKSIKASVVGAKVEILTALGKPVAGQDLDTLKRYEEEQKKIEDDAREKAAESEAHLQAHRPLSRSLTMFQVAIAVGAISVLTKRRSFWFGSLAFGALGVVFLVQGLL